ncbi:hydrogenase assembly protein HypC [Sulfolobus sp. A20]|uniref:HypC/HybG/HupF family hydrogenase formation chaperone n=1 Tax=Sulfolobaceae TaxID=118883 RepID=UPI000845C65D|nr:MULTISPECIES: HypC/HybG/HupF family hydrogenase formation chaperone [unclassified Sulfolobus]TRM74345.1 HypC/HybG/HupF family hydrogenase formation chaperone [Sulfolobus sp. E5]TRM79541.1 HypC/HybG/HupF family hydrogenase formation chaperone [Sulfolobus sp. B5]TRM82281.1 HypC/HybG/HupF family hydrogenase formation chaperone [Sulfolobus sp. D5]TRM84621.1 HypC/HybG/HupF family hydrogenase formation chaperone [Sulfolobus sp. A20-N-G8]TRM85167.1 HypC/HybG/HupF family hydrogenase formation chape
MCVAYPGKVIEINGDFAKVDFGFGTIKDNVLISLVNAKIGDYVLVHAGYAIQVVDEEEAKKTIQMWEEMTKGLNEEQRRRDLYEAIGGGVNE